MKIHGFLICLFLCFMPMLCIGANNTTDGDSQVLNINDLVDVAIKNNPRLLVARSIMDGKRGQVTQIRSQYLPHITFDGDIGRRHVEDETLEDDVDNVVHNGVSAAQLLTDFGNTSGAISSSNSRLNAAKSDYQQVGADIVLLIKSLYYQYWQKDLLISVAADQVENYKKHLHRAEEYLKHGIRTKIDVINAQVELSSSQLTLRKRQYDKQIALLELEKELGLQPNNGNYSVYVDEGEIDKLVTILPPLPPSLETLLTMASGQRSDLKSAKNSVIAANEEVRSVKGRYWPAISAIASAHHYDTDLDEIRNNWLVGIGLNWELFSGFETDGEMVEAQSTVRRFKSELLDAELNSTLEVTTSYIRADENRGNVELAHEIVVLAQENLKLADERYKSGIGDVIEYNDAQLRLTEARNSLVIAYIDYLTSIAAVERAIGTIPTLAGVE